MKRIRGPLQKGYLVIFICFSQLLQVKAEPIDLRFFDFKLNEELSAATLSCVEQDSLGFLWFGTPNGLFRYDGFRFKKYLSENSGYSEIYESNVYNLFADSYGKLWISLNSILCRYDIESDSIEVISNQINGNGLESPFISNYIESVDSVLYVTSGNTVYKYDRLNNSFNRLFSVGNNEISGICFDNKNNLWLGSSKDGIFYFDFSKNEIVKIDIIHDDYKLNLVTDIEWLNEWLWIATNGAGVVSYNPAKKELKRYPVYSEYELNIRSFMIDRESNLWMIDFTGLKLYLPERDFFQGYYPEPDNNYSISPYINKFFQDRDKNYWSLHTPGGIKFCPRPKGFVRFDSKVNSPFRLTVDQVSAINEDETGNLWMGNPFNGIDVFYWVRGKTVSYQHDPGNPESLGKGAVQTIFRDSEQRMWVGSYWGGLQQFIPEKESFKSYLHDQEKPGSISSNDIRSVCEDKYGNLWVCSHGKGIDKFNPETGEFQNFNRINNNLSNDYTFDILCDSSNNIWVGTAWGLSKFACGDSTFQIFLFDRGDSNSISSNIVYDIFEDRLNRIWIGTPNGLNLYDPENDRFKRFPDIFQNKNIVSIADDNKNNLWLGTQNGLIRFDPVTQNILVLTVDDGIISNEFSQRAVYDNGLNTLFFGSQDGITYFDLTKINLSNSEPEVYITSVKLQNEEIDNRNSKYLQKNILVTDTLELDYKNKRITFEFSSTSYQLEGRIRYACLLDGFESKWTYLKNTHEATYTNLAPGKYTFKVKAANPEGVWSKTNDLLLIVAPPFWNTIWFRIILLLTLFLIVLGIIKIREERLLRVKSDLEEKVQERTREIISQKEILEKQKTELEQANMLKNRFFNIIAHDLKAPISSIVQLTGILKENISNGIHGSNEKISTLASDTAEDTNRLLDDLLMWGRALSKNISFVFENINLVDIVSEVVVIIQPVARIKGIEIVMKIPQGTRIYADRNNLKVILRNLVSNAVKFSYPNSKVTIESKNTGNNEVMIVVADEGVGITKEKMADLFEPKINQTSRGTAGEKGHGMGLLLSRELVVQNNGGIWVESEPGKGSRFFFTLPALSDKKISHKD